MVELATAPIPAYTVRRPAWVNSIFTGRIWHAGVAELVDAPDSKSGFFGSGGSIPPLGTIFETLTQQLLPPVCWVLEIPATSDALPATLRAAIDIDTAAGFEAGIEQKIRSSSNRTACFRRKRSFKFLEIRIKERMKAIIYANYGSPEVLQLKEVEKPVPKADEVLIRVQAAEATKADVEMRSFRFAVKWFWLPLRIAFGIRRPKRQILGGYFSGEVDSLGKDVTQFSKGDQVFGATALRLGAYGEYVALPASYAIVVKPANMSFAEAAAVPLGGFNALHFMRLAGIQPGDKVLINGAGGSIGAHGVQIAKSMGAEVTVVDNIIKENLLRRLGANHFIDYTKENFAAMGRTYDVVFDMVAGSSYADCIKILNPKGCYLSGNPRLSVMIRSVFTTRFSNKTARFAFAGETKADLLTLKEMIEDGRIKSIVDRVYPMEQAPDAHRRVETEQRLGAVVLAIGERSGDPPTE